jgi:release factor glutamine methyltransferase
MSFSRCWQPPTLHTGSVRAAPVVVERVTARLAAAGCVAADEEADELVAAAPDEGVLDAWVGRRERGEPVAWITGTMLFCGRPLRVDPGVYVPRYETEELARRAATLLAEAAGGALGGPHAADLCTGAGAVAAHVASAVPGATVVGVDIDPRAVTCARRNGVAAVRGDLDAPLRSGTFDVVTAVAPYVPRRDIGFLPADVQQYEPRRALDGGDDGLDVLRRVVAGAARLLRPGGWLLVEVGGDQDELLTPFLAAAGFTVASSWYDDDGDLRGVAARMSAAR